MTQQLQPQAAPTAEDYAFSRLIAYAAYQWPGYKDAAHHRQIARKLEAVERGEIKRLMIFMPPRHGKSMLASEFFPAWYMGRNPDQYVVAATYGQDLADDFGRKVKGQIEDSAYQAIFPGVKLLENSRSVRRFHLNGEDGGIEHTTKQNGAYYAVGVGGPLTGRGAHLLLIDDPVKDRETADSEIFRRRIRDWYTSTAYTRLMPGGRIVVIQCMVGDTKVLMASGESKALREVRPGDEVATYDAGAISTSVVRNWASQGVDSVYAIRTSSGIIARANERHPFLVKRDGRLLWLRVRELVIGDKICRVERGAGSLVAPMDAMSLCPAKASVGRTTTSTSGQADTGRRQSTLSPATPPRLSTGTDSLLKSTEPCLTSKEASAPSASSRRGKTCERIGAASCASTTATNQGQCERCSAMTATLLLDTESPKKSCAGPLNTCAITLDEIESILPDGQEEVFDIEVAGTENFIADGLVSHNTRWHEDDLSGWLLNEHEHEGWEVLSLPALEHDRALWPEQYPVETLERIKLAVGPRDWSALYQQRPSPESGDYFKREWFQYYEEPPQYLQIYGASDYAITAKGGDYTVHGVFGVDRNDDIYLLDLWRQQATSDVWIDAFLDLVKKHKPIQWAEEQGQIIKSLDPFINKRCQERGIYVAREQFTSLTDKASRAQAIRGRMAQGKVKFPRNAPWLAELERELLTFPVGVNDDQADVLSLFGRMLDQLSSKQPPKPKQPVDRWDRAFNNDESNDDWKTA